MNLLKYEDYLSEKVIYDMLLESKVVFSKKLLRILGKMKSNKIANQLIGINSTDVDGIVQNYIDATDRKDQVSFTPDRKVQEIIKDKPEVYKVIDSGRYLTHSDRNNRIFERLGYVKAGRECWAPTTGTLGLVLKETQSVSGKTYCLFQEFDVENPKLGVVNKEALESESEYEFAKIWSTSRNPIAVGRLFKAILKLAGMEPSDKDLEDFVNSYKSTYDFEADVLKQFDVMSGNDIIHWYSYQNYVDGGGTLNNSCMSEADDDWLHIYSKNKQASLVILYGDEGVIKGDRYVDDKIKGRAILWDCEINGKSVRFMDRIYTTQDSDVELFKQYAVKNGWWYKTKQSMNSREDVTDGTSKISAPVTVCRVDMADPSGYYPYMDTLYFINTEDGIIGNSLDAVDPGRKYSDSYEDYDGPIRTARSTSGEWYSVDND